MINSEKYSLLMFVICVLYSLTALPRLDISNLFKNLIIFGSIPYLWANYKYLEKGIFKLIFAAIIIQIISWTNSIVSLPEFSKSAPNLKPLISLFMFALVAIWVKNNKNRQVILYSSLVVSFIVTALYDNHLHNSIYLGAVGNRIDFGMHNAQFTSMLSAVILFLTVYLSYCHFPKITKSRFILYPILMFVVLFSIFSIYASQSRQAWLAIIILLLFLPFFQQKKTKIRNIIVGYTLLLITIAAIFQYEPIKQRVLYEPELVSAIVNKDFDNLPMSNMGVRLNSWIEAVNWIKENPIFGSDFNSISFITRESKKFQDAGLMQFGHLHNTYMEIIVAYGALGVLFYCLFYKEIIKNISENKKHEERILLFCFLLFWLIINFFESFNHKGLGLYAHTIVLGGLYTLQRKKET